MLLGSLEFNPAGASLKESTDLRIVLKAFIQQLFLQWFKITP
jgi:hypothetical protein